MRNDILRARRSLAALNLAWLLAAIVAAGIGLRFGDDIARFKRVSAALDALEQCETDGDCESAWDALQRARGVR